ncbi:MAG: SH3 domain-containing protein [Anaerolineaceae bacterium]|nr:SH3 domain-containing protein [Anaerolineaceae bacterium]
MKKLDEGFVFKNLKNIILLLITLIVLMWVQPVFAQDATPPVPTVTGTPTGPMIRIGATDHDQINVRSGPGSIYSLIGVVLVGQEMPAKGRTEGGNWILIEYPGVQGGIGWVYAPYVDVLYGDLPIVEPPPTPTPIFTPTIDPTLAAQFSYAIEPTKLATFTPAPPIVIPTYEDVSQTQLVIAGVPMGLIILILGLTGILLAIITFTQRR